MISVIHYVVTSRNVYLFGKAKHGKVQLVILPFKEDGGKIAITAEPGDMMEEHMSSGFVISGIVTDNDEKAFADFAARCMSTMKG